MKSINLLITFDYELYLGCKSGTPIKCMIEPTNAVLKVLEAHKLKSIFFVDLCYLMRLSEAIENGIHFENHYKQIRTQLLELLQIGHLIFPHVHAHWLDAKINEHEDSWDLSNLRYYRFDALPEEERLRLFDKSMELLIELYEAAGVQLPKLGYRAGGWAIQPFSAFKTCFDNHKLKDDFSIIPGMYCNAISQEFDFTSAPTVLNYKFDEVNICNAKDTGEYTEWPISTIELSSKERLFSRVIDKILWKSGLRSLGDGIGAKLGEVKHEHNHEMASIELLNFAKIPAYLRFINEHGFLHLISHPKMLNSHNIKMFELLVKRIKKDFHIESDFNKVRNLVV